jgi:hypothetical protein
LTTSLAGRNWCGKSRISTGRCRPKSAPRPASTRANYGEAGALDLFGPRYGLPPAISGHQNYWLWGTHGFRGRNLIWLQWRLQSVERHWDSVEQVGEENRPIWLCRGLKQPLDAVWHDFKFWN